MTELLAAALDYASRGWPIFPCRADKTPYPDRGVLEATTDVKTIERWWSRWPRANIGLDVGSAGLMVLDLDPGHDKAELEKNFGGLPETKLKAKSPRGGEHWFYELEDGEIVAPSVSKVAPKVDVRSFHSYVLLYPSRTADGEYSWLSEGKPAFRTDEMVRVSNIAKEKSGDRDTWLIDADLPENVEAARDWLANKAKVAIEGQGGDHCAYATAAMMKSYGLSPEMAFDLMWEVWNPRCVPPWSGDQIEHLEAKVHHGYSYNTSPPGNMTEAYKVARKASLFSPVSRDTSGSGHEIISGRFRFVDRGGMEGIEPPGWIIEDLIPQDAYALLFGAPGTFKTFVALDMALSVATGFCVNPTWPAVSKSGPVLFIAGEGRAQLKKRVQAWERMHFGGERVENFVLADPVPLVSENWEPFVSGALAASPKGYALAVLDTVGRSMQGLNENAQENASNFSGLVKTLQHGLGCSVLALHHTGHEEARRARGSSVYGADTDTVLALERSNKDYLVHLKMLKQKDAEEWKAVRNIKLREIVLAPTVKTLVAEPAPASEVEQAEKSEQIAEAVKSARSKANAENEQTTLRVIEKCLIEVLEKVRHKEYSDAAMASILADLPEITYTPATLRTRYINALHMDTDCEAAKHWDVLKRRWRYHE